MNIYLVRWFNWFNGTATHEHIVTAESDTLALAAIQALHVTGNGAATLLGEAQVGP